MATSNTPKELHRIADVLDSVVGLLTDLKEDFATYQTEDASHLTVERVSDYQNRIDLALDAIDGPVAATASHDFEGTLAEADRAGTTAHQQEYAGPKLPTIDDLLNAIEQVESGGNPNLVGDNGQGHGPFQI